MGEEKKNSGEKQTWGGKSPRYRVKDEVCATSREKIDRERREGKRGEERRWGRGKRGKGGGYLARSKRSITGTSLVA